MEAEREMAHIKAYLPCLYATGKETEYFGGRGIADYQFNHGINDFRDFS